MHSRPFVDMPILTTPPGDAVRVLSIEIWRTVLEDWHKYLQGIDPEPPQLALPGRDRVYFTDPESIFICRDAADFGIRLELGFATDNGSGVVFFDPQGLTVSVPTRTAGATADGLTSGGAREWIIHGNPHLDLSPGRMEAFEVDSNSQRSGPVS